MDSYLVQLEAIYLERRRQLLACAMAVTRCPERAEDAVHEAFSNLTARRCDVENLKAYAFRAVHNAAVDQLRKNTHRARELDESFFDPAPGPDARAGEREMQSRIAAALGTLGDDERRIIVQYIWGELTFREIAELNEQPLGTAVSRYRRSLEKLRVRLEENER